MRRSYPAETSVVNRIEVASSLARRVFHSIGELVYSWCLLSSLLAARVMDGKVVLSRRLTPNKHDCSQFDPLFVSYYGIRIFAPRSIPKSGGPISNRHKSEKLSATLHEESQKAYNVQKIKMASRRRLRIIGMNLFAPPALFSYPSSPLLFCVSQQTPTQQNCQATPLIKFSIALS